jgi:hypothetical protein
MNANRTSVLTVCALVLGMLLGALFTKPTSAQGQAAGRYQALVFHSGEHETGLYIVDTTTGEAFAEQIVPQTAGTGFTIGTWCRAGSPADAR